MPNDLVELARICATHSRSSPDLDVAAQLMRMAIEYQCRAVEIKASRQIDLECLQVMRSVEGVPDCQARADLVD